MSSGREIDFGRPGVWDGLAERFLTRFDPRPSDVCGRVECEPGWNWKFRLPDYDLWLAVAGSGKLCVGGGEYEIRPGTLFCLRPDDAGWAVQDPSHRLTVVFLHFDFYVPGSGGTARPGEEWLPSRCVRFDDFSRIDRLMSRAVRAAMSEHPASSIEARSLLHLSLLEIYRQDAAQRGAPVRTVDPRVEGVVQYVQSRPSARLSLAQAAEMAGLSPDYFSRLFRSETGASFRDFVLRARMERARVLLEETGMRVGEVAESLGYSEVYLFSRQFRDAFGYPPSQARKGHAGP